MKLLLALSALVCAHGAPAPVRERFAFQCAPDAAADCRDHGFDLLVGDDPATATRTHVLCDTSVAGAAPCNFAAVLTSPANTASTTFIPGFAGQFIVESSEPVHFIARSGDSDLAVANFEVDNSLANGGGAVAGKNNALVTTMSGMTTGITVNQPGTTTAMYSVVVNCKTHTTAETMDMVTVTPFTNAAAGAPITFPCNRATATANVVAGVFRLEVANTITSVRVDIAAGGTLVILAGDAAPAERTEYAATSPVVEGPLPAAVMNCAAGSKTCTLPVGYIMHVLVGVPAPVPVPIPVPVPVPVVTQCQVTCVSLIATGACPFTTSGFNTFADAVCATGATRLATSNNCALNNTATITCVSATGTGVLTGAALNNNIIAAFLLASQTNSLATLYTALAAQGVGYAVSGVCVAACTTGLVDGTDADYLIALCVTPCAVNAVARRQLAGAPVIVCTQLTAAEQRLCFSEAVCDGRLLVTDTCTVVGVAELCPPCPANRVVDKSSSKKGLYGLLGLLALIPLLLCCCCLLLLLLLCLRRRKPAEPIMMPMTAAYPCVPEPCAVVPSCTPEIVAHHPTNAFACY